MYDTTIDACHFLPIEVYIMQQRFSSEKIYDQSGGSTTREMLVV